VSILSQVTSGAIPGPGSGLDRAAAGLQVKILSATAGQPWRSLVSALSAESWLGHPAHPAVVIVPSGLWLTSAVYDVRSADGSDPEAERIADTALALGLLASLPAALTGIAQFLKTDGIARRMAAVHWGLNVGALSLYTASWLARRAGRRSGGRRLSAAALALVGPGAYLGGELAYRYGVGQVVRSTNG
jgi:uncharacterized membrane protein